MRISAYLAAKGVVGVKRTLALCGKLKNCLAGAILVEDKEFLTVLADSVVYKNVFCADSRNTVGGRRYKVKNVRNVACRF